MSPGLQQCKRAFCRQPLTPLLDHLLAAHSGVRGLASHHHSCHSAVNAVTGSPAISKDGSTFGASGYLQSEQKVAAWHYCHTLVQGPHPQLGCHLPGYLCTFPSAAGSLRSGHGGSPSRASETSEVRRANRHTSLCSCGH